MCLNRDRKDRCGHSMESERELNILIGGKNTVGCINKERKFPKIEMYHLIYDKLKRKVSHLCWNG